MIISGFGCYFFGFGFGIGSFCSPAASFSLPKCHMNIFARVSQMRGSIDPKTTMKNLSRILSKEFEYPKAFHRL